MNRDEIGKLPDPVARLKAVAMDIGMPSTTTIDTEVIRAVLARLEDAEAALALVVERAAETALNIRGDFYGVERAAAIRALASPSGVEALAALRAERDALNEECDRHCDAAQQADGLRYNAEAERDAALARLAVAEGQVAALTEALEFYGNQKAWTEPPVEVLEGEFGPAYRNHAAEVRKDRGSRARAALATVTPPADTTEGRT